RMEYPGVGPELSFLKESGRVEICVATDDEALDAYERLCKLEGIYPSLEATHAFAILDKLIPSLPKDKSKVVVNCSGRGDKDAPIVFNRRVPA
ncbi:tryptophan synthase beta chain 2 chloroplastic-like, partial [Trifolium pratense]